MFQSKKDEIQKIIFFDDPGFEFYNANCQSFLLVFNCKPWKIDQLTLHP